MILLREESNGEKNKEKIPRKSKNCLHWIGKNVTMSIRNGLFSKGEYFNEG